MKDKVTLVTGATRGIGAAIARTLAEAGAKVIGTATSDDGADKITAALAKLGGRGIVLNVTDAAAIDGAQIGEQADGFLGVRGTVSDKVRSEMDAINIKRRAAYTDLAGQRGVTVKDVAAAVGCTTLKTRVGTGEAYMLRDGVWRVRQGAAPIPLPDYCS